MTITQKNLVHLALAVTVLAGSLFAFAVEAHRILLDTRRVEKISRVIRDLRTVLVSPLDAETGQRGFLLTGLEEYLDPFLSGQEAYEEVLPRLRRLLDGDPPSLDKLERINTLKEDKFDLMNATIRLRRAGDLAGAVAIVNSGKGKVIMDELRSLHKELLDRFLDERTAINNTIGERMDRAKWLFGFVTLVIAVILWGGHRMLSGALSRNQALSERLEHEATHDALTHLPNRRLAFEWLDKSLAQAKRGGPPVAVMYIDLDGFKQVNDIHGHAAGDLVLVRVAECFQRAVREYDLVGRVGGDEFIVVLLDAPHRDELTMLAGRLVESLMVCPLEPEEISCSLGASIGIAVSPANGLSAKDLVQAADGAMYQAKQSGKGRWVFA